MPEKPSNSVIYISSSDEELSDKDLSLEIVERAEAKEADNDTEDDNEVILVDSSSEDCEANLNGTEKEIKRMNDNESVVDAVAEVPMEEDIVEVADSVVTKVTDVNEVPDNAVMRKLLRGPRYFDPEEKDSNACFNCGDEDHTAVNCPMVKKKRPCFVCGMFGHNPWHCAQGQDCFICQRRGHIAKNCPDKNNHAPQDSTLCLRCGDLGHDMLSCENDYASGDLKEIQCYMCKNRGHFCCVDFVVDGPKVISCYNCAQPGHVGPGCGKLHGINSELVDAGPSALCFKCGKEGHFARGCTKKSKNGKWKGGSSTPRKRRDRKKKDSAGSQSAPAEFGKSRKKKKKKLDRDDNNSNATASKSRTKGGCIVVNPDDLPRREPPRKTQKSNKWSSPSTPNTHRSLNATYIMPNTPNSNGYHTPHIPFKKQEPFIGTPNPNNALVSSYHNQQYSYTPPNPQYNYNPNSNYHNQQFNYTPPSNYQNQHYSFNPNVSYHNQHYSYTPRPCYDNSRNFF